MSKVAKIKSIVLQDGKKAFTTTLILAEGVGIRHKNLMELIEKHREVEGILSLFETAKVSRGGRPVTYAILTEMQATFVLTLMRNSTLVVKFKAKLTKEFFNQKNIISRLIAQKSDPEWQDLRESGKIGYKQKTDVIKLFVDYATNQGSTSAVRYYANLATMENRALFFIEQKYKNIRDVLSKTQILHIGTADSIINKALIDGMDDNLHYKEIYKLAKARILALAEILGKTPVHNLPAPQNHFIGAAL